MSIPIAATPPMGWNSWNTFHEHISEELILQTADAMVERGPADAGYRYVIIDDCWAERERDRTGRLVPDHEKFPHGIKPIADHLHARGLKLGLYSCCGTRTCAGYPGSLEHEFDDARLFAEWGVDYLKYDNCFRPQTLSTPLLYRRMAMALRSCGRDIHLAACQWGTENVFDWIRSSGAQSFRSTIDIQDSWQSIQSIALAQLGRSAYAAPGCFNDMDMLVVGLYGKSLNPEVNLGGCTDTEYRTHFALWAMLNSPLIIGCDVRTLSGEADAILRNADIIAINQDPEGRSAYRMDVYGTPDAFALVRPLSDGSYAIGLFNFGDVVSNVTLDLWDIGLPASCGRGLALYDCLTHRDAGMRREHITEKIDPHDCRVYRCRVRGL